MLNESQEVSASVGTHITSDTIGSVKKMTGNPTNRHPTGRHMSKSTDSPTTASCGKRERRILGYMLEHPGEVFNIKAYARSVAIPRTTIIDTLERMRSKGWVSKPNWGNHVITEAGKTAYNLSVAVYERPRGECRGAANLSSHYTQYRVKIKDRSRFSEDRIRQLAPSDWRTHSLPNRTDYLIYFEGATIIIKTHEVVISVAEMMSEDVLQSTVRQWEVFFTYVKKVEQLGIITEGVVLNDGHYARVASLLGGALEKIAGRYFLDLGEGRKFWIDHSSGPVEDETNDADARENLDAAIRQICSGKLLDDMESALGSIQGLQQVAKLMLQRDLLQLGAQQSMMQQTQPPNIIKEYTG